MVASEATGGGIKIGAGVIVARRRSPAGPGSPFAWNHRAEWVLSPPPGGRPKFSAEELLLLSDGVSPLAGHPPRQALRHNAEPRTSNKGPFSLGRVLMNRQPNTDLGRDAPPNFRYWG
jgi:hypothetical protein